MKFWIGILGYAIAIILLFVLIKQCKPVQVVSSGKGDSTAAQAERRHIRDSTHADSLLELVAYWQDKYDSLKNEYASTKQDIAVNRVKAGRLMDSVRYYRSVNDTLRQLTNCYDLIQQDSVLATLLFKAGAQIDSMNAIHATEKAKYDSTVLALMSDGTQMAFSLSDLRHQYDEMTQTANKAIKKNKLSNFVSKVLGVTAAILVSALLIKK